MWKRLLLFIFLIAISLCGMGTNYVWTGAINNNWNQNGNWDVAGYPSTSSDIAYIWMNGPTIVIPAGVNITCHTVDFTPSGTDASTSLSLTSTSSLTVTDRFLIQPPAPAAAMNLDINLNGGTLTVNSGGVGFEIINNNMGVVVDINFNLGGGTLDIQGNADFQSDDATYALIDVDMTTAGSELKFGGDITFNDMGESILNSSGTVGAIHYTESGAQTVLDGFGGSALTYNDLTLSGSGAKTLEGNTTIKGDLEISGTASLDVSASGPYDINLAGNWTVTSTDSDPFVQRTGKVTFGGSSDQAMSTVLAGGETFYDVEMATSAGADLSISDDIILGSAGSIAMTSGDIVLGNNDVILQGTADITGGSASSYFQTTGTGMIQDDYLSVGTSETYPLGDAVEYSPLTFDLDAGTLSSAYIRVSVTDEAHPNRGPGPDFISRYWTITTSGISGSPNMDVTMNYADSDINGTESYSGWIFNEGSWVSGGTHTPASNLFNWDDFAAISDITLLGPSSSPLPIVLSHLEAVNAVNSVTLNWETATEINCDYFTIERSENAIDFIPIGQVEANGFSSTTKHYSLSDEAPLSGLSYYRLSQTDYDGTTVFYTPVAVERALKMQMMLSPNPVPTGGTAYLSFENEQVHEEQDVLVVVYDLTGKETYSKVNIVGISGNSMIAIDPEHRLHPGIYMVQASTNNQIFRCKLIIK